MVFQNYALFPYMTIAEYLSFPFEVRKIGRSEREPKVRRAHDLGITSVYVTHDQTDALTMSDRVAVFNDGRIQQLAPPDEIYEKPQNNFVTQFISIPLITLNI